MSKLLRIHTFGLFVGALTMALILSLIGGLVRPTVRDLEVPLAFLASATLLGWVPTTMGQQGVPFPQRSWQVPEQWRYTLPPVVTLGLYGYLLGLGGLTYMVLPTYWLVASGTVALATLPVALVAWAGFAAGRAVTTWRYARLVAAGSENPKPRNLRLTRVAGALLLTAGAVGLLIQAT